MKKDHTFTFTAAVILAGVVLAFVNPAEANHAAPLADSISASSSNLQNLVGAIAENDAPVARHGKHGSHGKGACPQISRADPRA